MRWNYRLGKLAGIEVNVHLTFLLLLAWVGLTGLIGGNLASALFSTTLVAMIFGIVVLHELGHALAARAVGVGTKDITLLPIGGVARLVGSLDNPRHEMFVAAAGPAVNVALAALSALGIVLLSGSQALPAVLAAGSFLSWMVWVNVTLVIFNLIPAFPMDGGRILRAFLATRMDYLKATETAARVARWAALAMGLFGLFTGRLTLVLIAFFVWLGAGTEVAMTRARSLGFFGGLPRQPQVFGSEVEVLDDPYYRPAPRARVFVHRWP